MTTLDTILARIERPVIKDTDEAVRILRQFCQMPMREAVQASRIPSEQVDFVLDMYIPDDLSVEDLTFSEWNCLLTEGDMVSEFFSYTDSEADCFINQLRSRILLDGNNPNSLTIMELMALSVPAFFDGAYQLAHRRCPQVYTSAGAAATRRKFHELMRGDLSLPITTEVSMKEAINAIHKALYNNARQSRASSACKAMNILIDGALASTVPEMLDCKEILSPFIDTVWLDDE